MDAETTTLELQVGEVHRGDGHLSLEYHLNARPSAKLDLSDALRDAGHDIPQRWAPLVHLHIL